MLCGLSGASVVRVRVPARVPLAVGVKVTLSVQKPPVPMSAPQLCETAKSPVVLMLLMFNAAVPVLLRVTVWVALVLAMFCVAKVSAVGSPMTTGTSLKVAVTVLAASIVMLQLADVPTLAQAPPQEIRLASGLAVRVTTSPGL